MGWIIKILAKASKVDMTDVMNQQMGSDIIEMIKDVLL